MKTKTKLFYTRTIYLGEDYNNPKTIMIDDQINGFLDDNEIELVDIKFCATGNFSFESGDFDPTALLIYKEKGE